MSSLPPGPTNYLAPFGLTFRHYVALRLHPIAFLQRLALDYGDISYFRIFHHQAVFIYHPDLIREVLVRQADNFPKFDRVRNHLRLATGDGLLVTEGEKWRAQRVALQKVFKSDRLSGFSAVTCRYASKWIDSVASRSTIGIEEEMTDLLQSIMGKIFFDEEVESIHQVSESVRIYSDIFHHESRSLFNWPDWVPTSQKKKKRNSIRTLRESLKQIVERRIRSGERREDLLDMLLYGECPHMLRHSDTNLKRKISEQALSQLLTMYVAGFHTTSVALAWLFYCVAKNPNVQKKLANEIDRVYRSDEMDQWGYREHSYLDQVVKESLRLYPAAWELFARQNIRATKLGDYHIPAGTLALISPYVTQRDPRFFHNPDKFVPERFTANNEQELAPYSYFPFGIGPHLCIGKALALMQMRIILAHFIRHFEFTLEIPNQKANMIPRVSARPDGDIKLNLRNRTSLPSETNALA